MSVAHLLRVSPTFKSTEPDRGPLSSPDVPGHDVVWVTRGRLVDRRHASSPGSGSSWRGLSPGPHGPDGVHRGRHERAAGERRHLLPRRARPRPWPTPSPRGTSATSGSRSAAPAAVTEEYATVVEGLEDLTPTVTLADVSETVRRPGHRHRDLRLDVAARPGRLAVLLAGDAHPRPTTSGWPTGTPRPSSPRSARRSPWTSSGSAPSAATSSARAGWPSSPTGRSCASASTAARWARPRRAPRPARSRGSSTSTRRRTRSRSRPPDRSPSSRRSSTARTRCRAGC